METISNLTGAARNAVWTNSNGTKTSQPGKEGEEPLSEQTGNAKTPEPYDAGNIGEPGDRERTTATDITEATDTSASGVPSNGIKQTDVPGNTTEATDTSASDVPSNGMKQTDAPGNTTATGPIRPEHETDKTGVTSFNQRSNAFGSDRPSNSNDTSGSGVAPSVGADPASAPQNTQKQQGADRPHEEPNGTENENIKATKAEAEEAQNTDVSSPGPQPLSKTHHEGGAPSSSTGDDDDGPQKESHGSGTGEKYVKSSGMGADGGDFDAANAGAGKEADRLLEQKGVSREPGNSAGSSDKPDPLEEKLNKPSLGQKIKAKLHKT